MWQGQAVSVGAFTETGLCAGTAKRGPALTPPLGGYYQAQKVLRP